MIIAITGAGGFIGRSLKTYFGLKGFTVRALPRINAFTSAEEVAEMIEGSDVVINLAGSPVIGRWSKTYKQQLFNSRIQTTRKITDAIGTVKTKPGLLISASAIGIYNQIGEQTESHFQLADDYLSEVCRAWESEANKANPYCRVAIIRLGIVLGKNEGALKRLLPLFKLGIGGKIASGKQGFSWIHIADVVNALQFMIDKPSLSGEFNFTAPEIVDNSTFTKTLAQLVGRPAFLNVPAFALKIAFGEGAGTLITGQFAKPERLLNAGFEFTYPELNEALKNCL